MPSSSPLNMTAFNTQGSIFCLQMVFLGRKHKGSTCYYITRIMTRTESEPLKHKESKAKALTPSMRSCLNPFRAFPHLLAAKLTTSLALDFLKKLDLMVAGEGGGFCHPCLTLCKELEPAFYMLQITGNDYSNVSLAHFSQTSLS